MKCNNVVYVVNEEDLRGYKPRLNAKVYAKLAAARAAFAELQGKPGVRARIVEMPWRPSRA